MFKPGRSNQTPQEENTPTLDKAVASTIGRSLTPLRLMELITAAFTLRELREGNTLKTAYNKMAALDGVCDSDILFAAGYILLPHATTMLQVGQGIIPDIPDAQESIDRMTAQTGSRAEMQVAAIEACMKAIDTAAFLGDLARQASDKNGGKILYEIPKTDESEGTDIADLPPSEEIHESIR